MATVNASFSLFDAANGGAQVGSTITRSITPDNGIFSESLDFGVNAYAPNQALWLATEVGGETLGRQKLEATLYWLSTRGFRVDGTAMSPWAILRINSRPNTSAFTSASPRHQIRRRV